MYLLPALLKPKWEGTPAALLHELETIAPLLNIDTTHKSWPRAPNSLTKRLNEIASNLDTIGVTFASDRKRTASSTIPLRMISLTKGQAKKKRGGIK